MQAPTETRHAKHDTCNMPTTLYEQWCCDLTHAACAVEEGCCGRLPSFDRSNCSENMMWTCTTSLLGPVVQEQIASGLIEFDPAAAQRFIDGILREGPRCEWINMWLSPGVVRDYITLRGAFRGTKEAGEECAFFWSEPGFPSACRDGYCEASAGGRCIEFVGRGEPCDRYHRCVDLAHPIESFATPEGLPDLYYIPLSPDLPELRLLCIDSRCQDRFAPGEPCTLDEECASLYCNTGRCRDPEPIGSTCTWWRHCASRYCTAFPGSTGTCEPSDRAVGDGCFHPGQCESSSCLDGQCTPEACAELSLIFSYDP